jgi:hypothetical protein
MLVILRIDELRYNSKLVAILSHTAFDNVVDAQFFSDLSDIDSLALVGEGGTAGDHHQVRESRERRDKVFGYAVPQITEVLAGAHIIERKNGYRGYSGGDFLCWRCVPASNWPIVLVPKLDLRGVCALW